MIAITLDRLIGYGPLISVSCRWCEYDEEDQRRSYADGEWQVWGRTADSEEYLTSGVEEAEAKALGEQAGLWPGMPF